MPPAATLAADLRRRAASRLPHITANSLAALLFSALLAPWTAYDCFTHISAAHALNALRAGALTLHAAVYTACSTRDSYARQRWRATHGYLKLNYSPRCAGRRADETASQPACHVQRGAQTTVMRRDSTQCAEDISTYRGGLAGGHAKRTSL